MRSVIKAEKAAKKKSSLNDLLEKEQKRQSEFEQKFEATAELEKQKREKAREKFAQALGKAEPNQNESKDNNHAGDSVEWGGQSLHIVGHAQT